VFAGELVGLRLRVELIGGAVHIFRILGVESFGKKFFMRPCEHGEAQATWQMCQRHNPREPCCRS
jgi:hypothetical protein